MHKARIALAAINRCLPTFEGGDCLGSARAAPIDTVRRKAQIPARPESGGGSLAAQGFQDEPRTANPKP